MSVQATSDKVWTILELINWGKTFFEEKNIDSPRLTIELMLAHMLKTQRIQLYTAFDRPLSQPELTTLRDMVRRRAKREPLQYILGEAHFYDIVLEVAPNVLIPRPETEQLVEYTLQRIQRDSALNDAPLRVLDIGTGSGCIVLALAKSLEKSRNGIETSLEAWDVSNAALALARKNAERLGIENINVVEGDILQSAPNGRFDVIVSNPPYIPLVEMQELEPEVRDFEPHSALTDNARGLRFYERFAEIFPTLLAKHGFFAVEIGFGQAEEVRGIFERGGFDVEIHKDLAGIPRVCTGRLAVEK
jgi:release factor glutamine methyltransferase